MLKNPSVIVITGPCGVGKTTITDVLAKELEILLIRGDDLKHVLYPTISDITQYPERLQEVKAALFTKAKEQFREGHSVVIDYVVLGSAYIQAFQEEFGEYLIMKVLFPPKDVIYQRDEQRDCWTSGRKIIDHLYEKFKTLEDLIGKDNYIDTSHQTPTETAHILLKEILAHDHA